MKQWVFALSMLAASAGPSAAEVIHATWGGGGAAVLREHFQVPFTQKTGIAARMAEVPNTAGAVRSPSLAAITEKASSPICAAISPQSV